MNKKLLTYFLLLFLAVTMPSCSNDNDNDEPESSVEDLIVGVWKEEFEEDSYSMLTFNNDGTYAYTIQENTLNKKDIIHIKNTEHTSSKIVSISR